MSDDARLREWLEATETAANAPAECALEVLESAATLRARLQESLEAEPPAAAPSADLARRLEAAEAALAARAGELRAELERLLERVRRLRAATHGYRPARSHRPAFISRSV